MLDTKTVEAKYDNRFNNEKVLEEHILHTHTHLLSKSKVYRGWKVALYHSPFTPASLVSPIPV